MRLETRTILLGAAAGAAVTAAVVVTVYDNSAKSSPQRAAVSAYIDRVNAIEERMHAPLTRVMLAYRDFSGQGLVKRNAAPELAGATKTLLRLDRRLAAVSAPPAALRLRRSLLSLIAAQVAITHEVQRLAAFAPRFTALLTEARTANALLQAALRRIVIPTPHALRGTLKRIRQAQRAFRTRSRSAADAQAAAIGSYDDAIDGLVRQLRRLSPPDVARPVYAAQLLALTTIRARGSRLAEALRSPKRTTVSTLGRRFALASRIAQSDAAQKAQIRAVRRYNARVRGVARFANAVRDELSVLQRTLP